ncbi:MAG TPA: hypothetical protein VMR62_24385 [Bryobacteraceae bacterium]|nr:hypothetical protein [Bryobacteraceae bacterium]
MPKRHRKLPKILGPDEVALLIASASNLFHQTILMTLYASHHIDLAYLYYLPFCSIFTSTDRCSLPRNRPSSTASS